MKLAELENRELEGAISGNSRVVYNPYLESKKKRALDVLGACAVGLALLPGIIFALVGLSLQRGPVTFRHVRLGKGGRYFPCRKFRTMVVGADQKLKQLLEADPAARREWERDFKLKNDPRVTTVGRLLRRTSCDELPQLLHVLFGDMSLSGPRPIVDAEFSRYKGSGKYYLACKPGLTGLWQASGRSDVSYFRRVAMDRAYAEKASFCLDLKIIFLTAVAVLKFKGAY